MLRAKLLCPYFNAERRRRRRSQIDRLSVSSEAWKFFCEGQNRSDASSSFLKTAADTDLSLLEQLRVSDSDSDSDQPDQRAAAAAGKKPQKPLTRFIRRPQSPFFPHFCRRLVAASCLRFLRKDVGGMNEADEE